MTLIPPGNRLPEKADDGAVELSPQDYSFDEPVGDGPANEDAVDPLEPVKVRTAPVEDSAATPLAQMQKALVPLAGTFLFAMGGALLDGNLTVPEVLVAAGGALTTAFGTYRIRNAR